MKKSATTRGPTRSPSRNCCRGYSRRSAASNPVENARSPRVRYSEPWGSEYLTPGLPLGFLLVRHLHESQRDGALPNFAEHLIGVIAAVGLFALFLGHIAHALLDFDDAHDRHPAVQGRRGQQVNLLEQPAGHIEIAGAAAALGDLEEALGFPDV